jgi:hypothetical protein
MCLLYHLPGKAIGGISIILMEESEQGVNVSKVGIQ